MEKVVPKLIENNACELVPRGASFVYYNVIHFSLSPLLCYIKNLFYKYSIYCEHIALIEEKGLT